MNAGRPKRANLLASIRSGQKLKKVKIKDSSTTIKSNITKNIQKTNKVSKEPIKSSFKNSKPDFQSEMAAKLQEMKQRKSSEKKPVSNINWNKTTRERKSTNDKNKIISKTSTKQNIIISPMKKYSDAKPLSLTNVELLKNKLDTAQDWQLKAIQAILKDD